MSSDESVRARTGRALGKEMGFVGDRQHDLVLQTKGRVKIQFGDKFIDLFNGSKFAMENQDVINSGIPGSGSEDGFYFDNGTLYLKYGDEIITIISGGELQGDFISFKLDQTLTEEERNQAKKNIGSVYNTRDQALSENAGNGLVFISSEQKAYILYNRQFYPIINNTTINQDQIEQGDDYDRYYFDRKVTIDIKNTPGPALVIEGVGDKYSIRLGDKYNYTNIYQGNDGAVIENNKSISLNIDGSQIVNITGGRVTISEILELMKQLVTDEIYSKNFRLRERGFGLWIDKATGDSYLQVDYIVGASFKAVPITHAEALELVSNARVKPNVLYVIIDFQNEWEITTDTIGANLWDKYYDAENGIPNPPFGTARNVRPIFITGRTLTTFNPDVSYVYGEDNKDIVQMLYDVETAGKGRIYYMRDTWNNEAPCDFKHYIDPSGQYIFNYNGQEASSLNTLTDIICSNNRILDVSIRLAATISPTILTGQLINNNVLSGTFNNVIIGDNTSTIENNYFNGNISNCNFIGNFSDNSIAADMDTCVFNGAVVNNEFNKLVSNTTFEDDVTNNIFDVDLTNCTFGKTYSNKFTGSFSDCQFLGNTYANEWTADNMSNCIFRKDVFSNQVISTNWSDVELLENMKNCIFQNSVTGLYVEGLLSTNQFSGVINNIRLTKPNNDPDYAINNNIINGLFENVTCGCDFSHNIISGPFHEITIIDNTTESSTNRFIHNTLNAGSIRGWTVNSEFRSNVMTSKFLIELTFSGKFNYNNIKVDSFDDLTFNRDFTYNDLKGTTWTGTIAAPITRSSFKGISNCQFRNSEINNAIFRADFSGINFSTNTTISNLDWLYNNIHQVEVHNHNSIPTVICVVEQGAQRGDIKMQSGLTPIQDGWAVCDGNNGTPNLIGSFILASTSAGQIGGTPISTLQGGVTIPVTANYTTVQEGTGASVVSSVSGGTIQVLPQYYSLIFIMKL